MVWKVSFLLRKSKENSLATPGPTLAYEYYVLACDVATEQGSPGQAHNASTQREGLLGYCQNDTTGTNWLVHYFRHIGFLIIVVYGCFFTGISYTRC